jgi:hypothetical protein
MQGKKCMHNSDNEIPGTAAGEGDWNRLLIINF